MRLTKEIRANNEESIKKLIQLVFKKAMLDSNETSAYGLSKYLTNIFNEKIKERTLTRYYDGYILNKEDQIKKPNTYNLDILSQYLEFESYSDFISDNKIQEKKPAAKINKKTKIVGVTIIGALMTYIGYDTTKKECMIWVNNSHYEAVSCEYKGELYPIPKDKIILSSFKRVNPDSTYPFFKIDGKENLWYERNVNGELEFFTNYGKHPITGETLRKITPYMIKKYIWKNFKY